MKKSEIILKDMRESMKSGDKEKLIILRLLVSSLENEKVNKKLSTIDELKDEDVITIVQKQVKLLDQEIESLIKADRDTTRVVSQKSVVSAYLPKQLSEQELEDYINNKINELNISSLGEQGKLMGILSKELKGKADLGLVSKIVRSTLK